MEDSINDLCEQLALKCRPLGIKLCRSEDDIPQEAYRPYRDSGTHYSFCQAVSMARFDQKMIAMTLEDEWCWKPPIAFGYVQVEEGTEEYEITLKNLGVSHSEHEKAAEAFQKFPKLPYHSICGVLIAPLDMLKEECDVVLVYCDTNAQARWLIGGYKLITGKVIKSDLDYIDSCAYSIVPTALSGECRVTIPDPGEMMRGMAGENEIIFSCPTNEFQAIADATSLKMRQQRKRHTNEDGTPRAELKMVPEFPRPEFYTRLYELWGLNSGGKVLWKEEERF